MINDTEKLEKTVIHLDRVRRDGGTQMREAISEVSVVTYSEHMQDGAQFPPITVFYDGSDYWLADGFHRCDAYERAGITEVPAEVRSGMRIDAIRFAMGTNDKNGRPRSGGDMRRIYFSGIENEMFEADDAQAVKNTAKCSTRWANRLTQEARDKAKVVRNEQIIELSREGKTQREIAEEVGVTQPTVAGVISDKKGNSSEIYQEPTETHTENHEEPVDDMGIAEDPGMQGEESERTPEAVKEAIAHNHRAQGTGDNEWYTPQEYVESARLVMGSIDLDPATSDIAQQRVKAGKIFTIEDDGLAHPWQGNVWLNPPYSQPHIRQFMEKVSGEALSGSVSQAIVLTHNYTDTAWFHIGVSGASAICFTRGRIGFVNPEGKKAAPTQGQAFFYYGDNTAAFREEFSKYGFVVEVMARQIARELAA